MPVQLLRPAAAAKRFGINRSTLWRWAQRPGFPPKFQIGPGAVAWREDDIDRYIENLPVAPPRSGLVSEQVKEAQQHARQRRRPPNHAEAAP